MLSRQSAIVFCVALKCTLNKTLKFTASHGRKIHCFNHLGNMTFSCFWEKEQLSAADPRQTDTHGALLLALHTKPDPVYAADQDVSWTAVSKTLDGRAPKLGPRGITEPCMHMVQNSSQSSKCLNVSKKLQLVKSSTGMAQLVLG